VITLYLHKGATGVNLFFSISWRREIYYGAGVSGITFMVDEHGNKTAAVIDLKRHERLWEDIYDSLLAQSRAREPRESLELVRRKLKRKVEPHG